MFNTHAHGFAIFIETNEINIVINPKIIITPKIGPASILDIIKVKHIVL